MSRSIDARTHSMASPPSHGRAKPPRRGMWRTAATSDPFELYELAVQEPTSEVKFFDRVYRERRGRLPATLREDFCGSAAVSAAWIRRRTGNRAVGVDLDPRILDWGTTRHLDSLTKRQRARVRLVRGNVLSASTPRVDVLAALNFSYAVFQSRAELVRYFRTARTRIAKGGIMVLDCYGGSEAHAEVEEERQLDGFTYVWDQSHCNPITGRVINHIHFRFPDGSQLRKAFTYDWRLWSIPELRDALSDAGFSETTVYWEGTERATGTGNGKFVPSERGEACEGWIAYLVADR